MIVEEQSSWCVHRWWAVHRRSGLLFGSQHTRATALYQSPSLEANCSLTIVCPSRLKPMQFEKLGDYSWATNMSIACPPPSMDTLCPWVGWGRGHIQSTPSLWVYMNLSIPPLLRPHSSGSSCWTNVVTWRPRWVWGPILWVCVQESMCFVAPHWLAFVIHTFSIPHLTL